MFAANYLIKEVCHGSEKENRTQAVRKKEDLESGRRENLHLQDLWQNHHR
jgi:hypothetical protein